MRVLISLLMVFMSAFSWAEADKPVFGELSIFSDRKTSERLQPNAQVCMQGDSCAGQKPGQAIVIASDSTPKGPEEIYQANCAACHNAGVAGAPKMGDAAVWTARLEKGLDQVVKAAVVGQGAMPPKGMCSSCSESDIKGVIEYMLNESGVSDSAGVESSSNQQSAVVQEEVVAEEVTKIDGEAIYSQRCSVCHGQGVAGAPKLGDKSAWESRMHLGVAGLTENAIKGVGAMPPKGACNDCSDEGIEAAVEYMVLQLN